MVQSIRMTHLCLVLTFGKKKMVLTSIAVLLITVDILPLERWGHACSSQLCRGLEMIAILQLHYLLGSVYFLLCLLLRSECH